MKTFLTLILFSLSTICIGQDWQTKIASKFYSKIDSGRTFECCDKNNNAISIDFTYSTYEMPYTSPLEVFDNYYNQVIDSTTIVEIVNSLAKSYNKIPKRFRKNFTKSCYNIETTTKVFRYMNGEIYFTEGDIHFVFSFQMDKPYKRSKLKKMFGVL